MKKCPKCSCQVGQLHRAGCGVEQCPYCGGQLLSCCCDGLGTGDVPADDRMPWTGLWPGVLECRELGWYARRHPTEPGYLSCGKEEPGAIEDLNRLHEEARWDRQRKRFVKK